MPSCPVCGAEFEAVTYHQKYCSRKCQMKQCNILLEDRLKRTTKPFSDISVMDVEAIDLHTEKKMGINSIARLQGRSKSTIRRALIASGQYNPPPLSNGLARKGQGHQSRILQAERRAANDQKKRDNDVNVKGSTMRQRVAKVLRGLKNGTKAETTCRQNGWPYSQTYDALKTRPQYRKRFAGRCLYGNGYWSEVLTETALRSKKFKDEAEFQAHVARLRPDLDMETEKHHGRIDFTKGETAIEAKIQTNMKAIYALIGQCVHARHCGYKRTMAVIASDCRIPKDVSALLNATGIEVYNEESIVSASI